MVVGASLQALNLKVLYDDALAAAYKTTRNLAHAFAEHTARTFEVADRALLAATEVHDDAADGAGQAAMHDELKEIQGRSEVLQSMGFMNAAGDLTASSLYPTPPYFNGRETEQFRIHAERNDAGLFIGSPLTTQLSNAWVVPLSRRLARPDGAFDGVVNGMIDLSYFKRLFESMQIGRTQTIALLRRDGLVEMRQPVLDTLIGHSIAQSPLFLDHLPAADHGTFEASSAVDSVDRIVSYSSVRDYPLIITVTVAKDEALAGWRRQVVLTTAALAAFLALIVGLAALLIRRLDEDEARRRAIEAARAAAEQANQAKSAFLSHMSHELRTPLNAILGFSELIRDRGGSRRPEAHRDYAAEIHKAGSQLLDLVNDVLDLAKIEARRHELEETVVELSPLIESVLRQHAPVAAKGKVALTMAVPADLPALMADQRAVVQMLNNLVSNAVKFTSSGGEVEIRAAAMPDGLTIAVRDTGIGIPTDRQKRIFESFAPTEDPMLSSAHTGTGLGLAIVRGLILLHDGEVRLSSVAGQGTEVTLTFPASRMVRARAAA